MTVNPPSDVTPYNATYTAQYTDLPQGHNLSYYFEYGSCTGFPGADAVTTPVQYIYNASTNGSIPATTVGGLNPSTTYCMGMCLQDTTAGSGYSCTISAFNFSTPKAPEVVSGPPTNIGASACTWM